MKATQKQPQINKGSENIKRSCEIDNKQLETCSSQLTSESEAKHQKVPALRALCSTAVFTGIARLPGIW